MADHGQFEQWQKKSHMRRKFSVPEYLPFHLFLAGDVTTTGAIIANILLTLPPHPILNRAYTPVLTPPPLSCSLCSRYHNQWLWSRT
jgi:hypothetical protein